MFIHEEAAPRRPPFTSSHASCCWGHCNPSQAPAESSIDPLPLKARGSGRTQTALVKALFGSLISSKQGRDLHFSADSPVVLLEQTSVNGSIQSLQLLALKNATNFYMFLTAIGWLPFLINSSGLFLIMVALIMLHLTPRGLLQNWRVDGQGDLFHPCFSVLVSEEEKNMAPHVQNGSRGFEARPVTHPTSTLRRLAESVVPGQRACIR